MEQAGSVASSHTSSYTAVQTGEEEVVQCCFVTGEHSFLCMVVHTWVSTVRQTDSHSGSLKHRLFSRSSAATLSSWQPSWSAVRTTETSRQLSRSDTFS